MKAIMAAGLAAFIAVVALARLQPPSDPVSTAGTDPGGVLKNPNPKPRPGNELISLSAGCFWGAETTFRKLPGVVATAVGYTGGTVAKPTYEQVCTSQTGHAESVLVEFDPKKTSLRKVLATFWQWHNPTVRDRQGPDVGPQYRSAIWFYDSKQIPVIKESIATEQKNWKQPIVTTVKKAEPFWAAEDYHQQYDAKTGHHCLPPRNFPDF